MKENARQRFWNGSRPPFGYRLEVVEMRGEKPKHRLAVAGAEAETVRMIFGFQAAGLGIKAIAQRLNASGIPFRGGKPFRLASYIRYDRVDMKTGAVKADRNGY